MRDFIEENKNLVIVVSIVLILGSLFVSARKAVFYSPPGEDFVFLDVYGNKIVASASEPTAVQIPLSSNVLLTAIITPFLIGGWLLIRKLKGKHRPPVGYKKDGIKKDDLKRIQEALELYYRLRQHYPEAGDEFEEIIKNLKPPLEGLLTSYHYENPESDTQRYRLWCLLENKTDPEAKDGVYELTNPF